MNGTKVARVMERISKRIVGIIKRMKSAEDKMKAHAQSNNADFDKVKSNIIDMKDTIRYLEGRIERLEGFHD